MPFGERPVEETATDREAQPLGSLSRSIRLANWQPRSSPVPIPEPSGVGVDHPTFLSRQGPLFTCTMSRDVTPEFDRDAPASECRHGIGVSVCRPPATTKGLPRRTVPLSSDRLRLSPRRISHHPPRLVHSLFSAALSAKFAGRSARQIVFPYREAECYRPQTSFTPRKESMERDE